MAFSVSSSQHIKLIKSVISLVLKNKTKVTAIVCVFYENHRLKIAWNKKYVARLEAYDFKIQNELPTRVRLTSDNCNDYTKPQNGVSTEPISFNFSDQFLFALFYQGTFIRYKNCFKPDNDKEHKNSDRTHCIEFFPNIFPSKVTKRHRLKIV